MDPQKYREQIEEKILLALQEHLQNGEMDATRAQEIAKYVLEVLRPEMTLEQIDSVLPQLRGHFQELAQALNPIIREHEQRVKSIITQKVNTLINQGKIDEATRLLKNANRNDSQK